MTPRPCRPRGTPRLAITTTGAQSRTTGGGADAGDKVPVVAGTRFCLSRPGFAVFRMEAEALDLTFRDLDGQAVYRVQLPRNRQGKALASA